MIKTASQLFQVVKIRFGVRKFATFHLYLCMFQCIHRFMGLMLDICIYLNTHVMIKTFNSRFYSRVKMIRFTCKESVCFQLN